MPVTIAAAFSALVGLVFGSFLNVCITRLPRGESIVHPQSHCPRCGRPIAWRDNIPLLSWLLLRAKCRACGERISWRYPIVELSTSLLFLACWLSFGPGWQSGIWTLLCFLLLGLAVMDAETMLLPDRFTMPGLVLGILAAGVRGGIGSTGTDIRNGVESAGMALLDAGIAAGALLVIIGVYWLARHRRGMGMGDVKLLAMLAAWLGLPQTALVFTLAVAAGAVYGVALVIGIQSKQRGASARQLAGQLAIPFGAFLSFAGLYSIFLGERTLRWYLQLFR